MMNLDQITSAVDQGRTVHWQIPAYRVIKGPAHHDAPGNDNNPAARYLICHDSGQCIGLTWSDGTTLNGKEVDFCLG